MIKYIPYRQEMIDDDMQVGGVIYSENGNVLGSFQGNAGSEFLVKIKLPNDEYPAHIPKETHFTEMKATPFNLPSEKQGQLTIEEIKDFIGSLEHRVHTHQILPEEALLVCCGFTEAFSYNASMRTSKIPKDQSTVKPTHDTKPKVHELETNPDDIKELPVNLPRISGRAIGAVIFAAAAAKMADELEQSKLVAPKEKRIHKPKEKHTHKPKEKKIHKPEDTHAEQVKKHRRDKPHGRE